MRTIALILALAVPQAFPSAEDSPYSVDVRRVLNAAAKALKDEYPQISSENVTLGGDLHVQCLSTRPALHVSALDETFKPCEAQIVFDLSATNVDQHYLGDGECVRVVPPDGIFVYVYEDGSSKVETQRGWDSALQVVKCTQEVIDQLADEPKRVLGEGKAFSVNPRTILKLAIAAAIEEYPDTSPNDLDLDGMISLFCDVSVPPGGQAGQDLQIKPCTASVRFQDRSIAHEKKYMQGGNRCFLGPKHGSIVVHVRSDESTIVNRSEGGWSEVACNEEFYDALEQASD